MFPYAYKCNTVQACRLESSPYIPPSQEKSTYLNSASFLKYSKLNQPMLFPSKISNHLSPINRTFPCLWDATTQKITGQYHIKPLNSPTDDQETTYTTVEAVDATLQYLSQALLPRCRFQNQECPNSNVNNSIDSWSGSLSNQRIRWGIVYSWKRLTNSPWRPITIICDLFWCSRNRDAFNFMPRSISWDYQLIHIGTPHWNRDLRWYPCLEDDRARRDFRSSDDITIFGRGLGGLSSWCRLLKTLNFGKYIDWAGV